MFSACLHSLAPECLVSVRIGLEPAGPIKEGADVLLYATALGSRMHVHLVLLSLHLLRLAHRSAFLPNPCKEEASFLNTCKL